MALAFWLGPELGGTRSEWVAYVLLGRFRHASVAGRGLTCTSRLSRLLLDMIDWYVKCIGKNTGSALEAGRQPLNRQSRFKVEAMLDKFDSVQYAKSRPSL